MKVNHYTPESLAKKELKKAESAWIKAQPGDVQAVKESYRRLRMAKINYKRIMRAIAK